MALQNCLKGLNSALAALLSEPAPGDTVTPGLIQRYNAVNLALQTCYNLSWSNSAAKSMLQKQVFLKLWQLCSQLAAAHHFVKAMCAVDAAYMIMQKMQEAGLVDVPGPAAAQVFSLAGSSVAMAQDLRQSGFLNHMPTLLTDAAHQLQAVAGVWPVSADEAVKARFEHVVRVCPPPGFTTEQRAISTQQLLVHFMMMLETIFRTTDISAGCLQAADHLVLASWQYLSTILQGSTVSQRSRESSTMQHFTALTTSQQHLTNNSTCLAVSTTTAVLNAQAVAQASAEAGGGSTEMAPRAWSEARAVFNRHHAECMALCMVLFQLTRQMRNQQEQQTSSSRTNAAQQQAAGHVPAALHRMLQQLGVDSSAAVWALKQSSADPSGPSLCNWPSAQIEAYLVNLANGLLSMCQEGQDFNLIDTSDSESVSESDSEGGNLPEQQELQQQLQLLILFPAVLLQWVADIGNSSSGGLRHVVDTEYVSNCSLACWTSCSLIDTYSKVLRDGPASLYEHMTGQMRPWAPPCPSPTASLSVGSSLLDAQQVARALHKVRVPQPADAFAGQLQVLGQLLPTLLRLWGQQVGLADAAAMELAKSGRSAAGSTSGQGGRGGSSSSRRIVSGSSNSSRVGPHKVGEAVSAAGDLLLQMVEQFPAPVMGLEDTAGSSSSAEATAAAAGQLCALLEHVCRTEMSVTQHFSNRKVLGSNSSSSSRASQAYPLEPDHLYNVSNNLITWQLVADFFDDPNVKVSPLVDAIIALSSPGSQPSQQLCSLLATLLKVAKHVSSRKPSEALSITEEEFGMFFQRNHFKPYNVLIREIARVIKITCAAIECATMRQAASAAGSSSGSRGSSSSSSKAAGTSDVSGSMSLLVLLGRCCLQLGDLTTSVSPTGCMLAAALKFYLDAAVQASIGWLSADTHAAQLGALGYDAEDVLNSLHIQRTAAALSDKVARLANDRNARTAAQQAAVSQLQEQLRLVGQALTTFAHPSACNNPACMSFQGPSEASLVQGSSGRCSSCKAARYCCKSCQKAAWKQHKPVCKALTASAAATAAATAVGRSDAAAVQCPQQ